MHNDALLFREARILLIGDEESDLRLLRRLLHETGYVFVTSTTDLRAAPDLFEQFCPDLALLDLRNPVFRGLELMQELRDRLAEDEFLPVILLTGDSDRQTRQHCLDAGVNDLLPKPCDRKEVLLRIRNLLRSRFLHVRCQREMRELDDRVRERTREAIQAQIEVIDRLAAAAEFRDSDTSCHTGRVGDTVAAVAEALRVPHPEISVLRRAAPLHDIGKIGIPDSILLKPGRLTPEEFETMKQHTTIGARILSGSRFPVLKKAEEIALTHHENWDGSGYPNHLSHNEIPLAGRIVAVADVFDALIHDRPYKQAWPVDKAVQEIRSLSGSKFDPVIVDAFLSVVFVEPEIVL